MSAFVPGVKPDPAAYTFSFVQYLYFGAPAGVVEEAEGGAEGSVVAVSVTNAALMFPESSTVRVPIVYVVSGLRPAAL